MIKKSLFLKYQLQNKYLKKNTIINLSKKFDHIFSDVIEDINNPKKTLNVLNKIKMNFKQKELDRFKNFNKIALIGMGGSILGAEAIHSFLETNIKKKMFFFNDLDEKKILNFKKKENMSKILFIIISKSGNTIETLSNAFFLDIIKKNTRNVIIISEKKNNSLFLLSKKFNIFFIEHRKNVGGRYSVLTEVGIVPAYLMGANIKKLRSKMSDFLTNKNKKYLKTITTTLAYLAYSKNMNNLIFLNYVPKLEKFLYWCQQLIAESLGKKGKGFLPVVSNVPKDHHSLLQLYLDGPKDKLFYIFSSKIKSKAIIRSMDKKDQNSFLNNKQMSAVKNAQKKALIKALTKKKIIFREFIIEDNNEEMLCKLFTYFMIETVIIGKLLNIDPFDQPAVEEVKIFTKKLLK